MSTNWDGRRYQGAEQNAQAAANAQAAQQSVGDARNRYVSLDGAKAALCAFNEETTAERLVDAVCVLVGPLPDGEVKTALRGMLVEAVSARLQARRSELKQDLLDAAAFFAR